MSAPSSPTATGLPPATAAESSGSTGGACASTTDNAARAGPRHSRGGPATDTPTVAMTASSSADHAHAFAAPAAALLHRHALECVFAFLRRGELALALRVSRDWLAAVSTMRRLQLTLSHPAAPLAVVVQSAMARHVADISGGRLDAAGLSTLAGRMAHLRSLNCGLLVAPATEPLRFPAQLRRLDIDLTDPADCDAADINAAMAAIGRLQLLVDLRVMLPAMDPQISFAPLAALPLLRHFYLWHRGDGDLSDAQVDQLRALTRLRQLHMDMTSPLLRQLLRPPHDLQWQQISLPHPFDDEAAALLPLLPSLTSIDEQPECQDFDWLRGLPNLTEVSLAFDPEGAEGRADSLVAGLQSCTNIEILRLNGLRQLTATHLTDLLPRLSRLREMELMCLRIDSLSFLAQAPLPLQLSRLVLHSCRELPPSEARHVHGLRGLTKLVLFRSFTAPLEDDERALNLLTPPSALLPLLDPEHFHYSYSR